MDLSKTHKQLKYDFVFAVGVALLGVLIGYIAAMYISEVSPSVVNVLKTIVILYVLISIPLSLSLFKRRLAKISTYGAHEDKIRGYINISRIRILFIIIGLLCAIILFFVCKLNDMLYLIGIELIILVLCIPTHNRVEQEMAVFMSENNEIVE